MVEKGNSFIWFSFFPQSNHYVFSVFDNAHLAPSLGIFEKLHMVRCVHHSTFIYCIINYQINGPFLRFSSSSIIFYARKF